MIIKEDHQYYQIQQQLFTTGKNSQEKIEVSNGILLEDGWGVIGILMKHSNVG